MGVTIAPMFANNAPMGTNNLQMGANIAAMLANIMAMGVTNAPMGANKAAMGVATRAMGLTIAAVAKRDTPKAGWELIETIGWAKADCHGCYPAVNRCCKPMLDSNQ